MDSIGILSVVPAALAIILAFVTRDAIFSLALASIVGFVILGNGLADFPGFLINTIADDSFAWVFFIELLIGVLIALFQLSDVSSSFYRYAEKKQITRKQGQVAAWFSGLAVFFSDYFSPVFVGTSLRPLTDKLKISREKLAYICDSTSAPVIILIPITGWAVYITGILEKSIPGASAEDAFAIFTNSIIYNFYAILAVLLVGLIAFGVVKDFGPMKAAEERAQKEGKVLSDDAVPMIGQELDDIKKPEGINTKFSLNFVVPVAIIIAINVGSFILYQNAEIVLSFSAAIAYLIILLTIQGAGISHVVNTSVDGIKAVMPAVMILLFAYAINAISQQAGTGDYLVSISQGLITPAILPAIIFLVSAIIAFATGTSWGTFAIVIPIAAAMSLALVGTPNSVYFYMAIGAACGGGVFGDHCSPLSDTTVLSSMGAASDHMHHVRTQIPYALTAAALSLLGFLGFGMFVG